MGSRRGQLALVAVMLVAAFGAANAWGSSLRVLIRQTPNKTDTNRSVKTISGIVIHDTEGRFIGSVRVLQRARTNASAHFVVSRRGQVVQLVSVTDVAWHAGNNRWNRHSIGIEHEGWTGRGGFTDAQYRASPRLVAYLARRYGITLHRAHIVGHNEVPNPYHRRLFGGVDGHSDPGPYWRWGHYMALVRAYAIHPEQPYYVRCMRIEASPDEPPAPSRPVIRRSVVDGNATVR